MRNAVKKITRLQVLETFAVFAALLLLPAIYYQRMQFTMLAFAFLSVALFLPPLAEFITIWWLKLSLIISSFNSRVILVLLFYLILTPIAFVYRLFNKDPLNLDMDNRVSFFSERNHVFSKADLEKMW